MVVTQQIDALRVLGTDPIRKLVAPRLLAGIVMVPILTIISDTLGIFGGSLISIFNLKLSWEFYWRSVGNALAINDLVMGLRKPVVFGFILASVGCHMGLRTKGGTQGVGAVHHALRGGGLGADPRLRLLHDQGPAPPLPGELGWPGPPTSATSATKASLLDEGPAEAAARDVDEPVISLPRRPPRLRPADPARASASTSRRARPRSSWAARAPARRTILRLILGLLKPDAGSIVVDGTEVTGLTEEELRDVRLKIGMVFQEGALFDSLTVGENVGYRLIEDGRLEEEEIEARVREMLGFVGLATHYDQMPSELSGGQRRRVAVARALVARPQIMLYDEPTTGLDPITATTITDLIVQGARPRRRELDPGHPPAPRRLQRGAHLRDQRRTTSTCTSVVDDISTLDGHGVPDAARGRWCSFREARRPTSSSSTCARDPVQPGVPDAERAASAVSSLSERTMTKGPDLDRAAGGRGRAPQPDRARRAPSSTSAAAAARPSAQKYTSRRS